MALSLGWSTPDSKGQVEAEELNQGGDEESTESNEEDK